jgi:glycosyltransferase involved in cell wall biosynthesis
VPDCNQFESISVIIPTYNRASLLSMAIEGFMAQRSPYLIRELLVIDDGSTDNTEEMVQAMAQRSAIPIRYLRQSNRGPSAARNYGIREASSELILFTDDDVIPGAGLVEQHVQWHNQNPQCSTAVLGFLTWHPHLHATPFMRWYGEYKLFNFGRLKHAEHADFHAFYTCNLSLKTEFLRNYGQFDEDFKRAAFEDTELGYRLSKHGLQLLYNRNAIAYHYQFFSYEDACRKTKANTSASELFFQKEAGQQFLREIQAKQARLPFKFGKLLAPLCAAALAPLRKFVDSSHPLPGIVYHMFFWSDMRVAAKADRVPGAWREHSPTDNCN